MTGMRWLRALGLAAWLAASGAAADGGPQRVVCVGGALTEIVHALGAGSRLVAVDTTSVYPEAVRRLPLVGYQRTLSAEGVLAQRPDLVIATTDAGPPAALRQIRDAGVRVELVPVGYSIEAVNEKIRRVSAALALPREGQALEQRVADGGRALHARVSSGPDKPRVLFILAHAGPALMVAGTDTAADAMIRLAGGVNPLEATSGYKPLSPEAVIGAAPQALLITDEGLHAVGGKERLLQKAGLSRTPAARSGRVISMDSLRLLGFGPRTPQAALELAHALAVPSPR
jgi:iron complex transport system substrate-binding protein